MSFRLKVGACWDRRDSVKWRGQLPSWTAWQETFVLFSDVAKGCQGREGSVVRSEGVKHE